MLKEFNISKSNISEANEDLAVSVIVPTYNEIGNVRSLVERLENVFEKKSKYEIVFIDDNSTDNTYEYLLTLSKHSPHIRIFRKVGKKGKSYSILEGLEHVQYEIVAMIDADLQYPPEAIPQMVARLSSGGGV